ALGVLGAAIAGALALELAVRLLVSLGLLERGDLRLGQQDTLLGYLGLECLEAVPSTSARSRAWAGSISRRSSTPTPRWPSPSCMTARRQSPRPRSSTTGWCRSTTSTTSGYRAY